MVGALPGQTQRELFRPLLTGLIDPRHELAFWQTASTGTILKQRSVPYTQAEDNPAY
jgi:hypothetical protein